jgi:hypothetical protein
MTEGEITQRTAKELSEKLIYDGGFTYNPNTKTQPTEGLAVSTYPENEKIIEWSEDLTTHQVKNLRRQLRAYVKKHKEDFNNNPRAHFGGWYDAENGRIYLDVTTIVNTDSEALKLSKQHNQEAYFNLETFETIRVGARDDSKPRPKETAEVGASTV